MHLSAGEARYIHTALIAASVTRLCKHLTDLIETSHRQPDTIFAQRVTHSSMNESSSCWADLRHYAGRLVSYPNGVRTLSRVAEAFPRLLEDFEVVFVRSSEPDDNPMQCIEVTAEKILAKMIPDAQTAARYAALVQETRSLDLDGAIQATIGDDTFRPIVHAELLVLQSLEREDLTHPSHFYGAWKYIGSSKPTCRLCSCYFQEHSGGFRARPTHGNLYLNWKPPDVFQRDGEAAIRARTDMLNRMVDPIRAEALRTLTEKVPLGKQHDSSTGMTFRTRALGSQGQSQGRGPSQDQDAGSVDGEVDEEAYSEDDADDGAVV